LDKIQLLSGKGSQIILSVDDEQNPIFHYFCDRKNNLNLFAIIKHISDSFGANTLEEFILLEDGSKNLIFHNFLHKIKNSIKKLLQILESLIDKFDRTFIKDNLIFHQNTKNDCFFNEIFAKFEEFEDFKKIYEILGISNEELKISLNQSKLTFYNIAQKPEKTKLETLKFLKENLGDDFLEELVSRDHLEEIIEKESNDENFGGKMENFLGLVKSEFGKDSLKNCLIDKGNTIIMKFVNHKDNNKILKGLFESISANLSQDYFKKFLLKEEDTNKNNFLYLLPSDANGLKKAREILEILKEIFRNNFNEKNKIFFEKLIKSKQDPPQEFLSFLQDFKDEEEYFD
jgi:hypothetical protein